MTRFLSRTFTPFSAQSMSLITTCNLQVDLAHQNGNPDLGLGYTWGIPPSMWAAWPLSLTQRQQKFPLNITSFLTMISLLFHKGNEVRSHQTGKTYIASQKNLPLMNHLTWPSNGSQGRKSMSIGKVILSQYKNKSLTLLILCLISAILLRIVAMQISIPTLALTLQ